MRWLTEMGVFAKVVEADGFGKAALQLGLTRSAVSKHVSRLEAGLGVKLLHRTTRAMSLTEAGQAVYTQCAVLAQAAEAAEAAAARLAVEPRGTLRISVSVAFGQRRLLPLLPSLLERYPELRVDVTLLDRFVDLAEEGFDVVLRLTDQPPETLAARHLATVCFVLCAAPDYLVRRDQPERPEDLAGHNCICQGHPKVLRDWRFTGPTGEVTQRVDGNALVNGSEAVRQLLIAGLGCGVLPDFVVADDLRGGRLTRLMPSYRPLGNFNNLHALYQPSRQGNPKVRAFIDWLVLHLADQSLAEPPDTTRM
jgi:DNA-binding transcriptional LysR family regulator